MAPKQYNDLVKARKYCRTKISKLNAKLIEKGIDNGSEANVRAIYLDRITDHKTELESINNRIHEQLDENVGEEIEEAMLAEEESYEDLIVGIMAKLRDPVIPGGQQFVPSVPNAPKSILNQVKLPVISLPVFSNLKSESLERFFHGFEAIMEKQIISPYEKFMYLKGQLSKAPLALINSLDSTSQTYEAAKKLLCDAFASKLSQQYDAIKQLSELNLSAGDDVYEFISEMRNLISSFNILKIDINLVLQYFIWNAMNPEFQQQLINITNQEKPTLNNINESIFSATNRYMKIREQQNLKLC